MFNRKTRWVWDGNVPLHEWNEVYTKDFTEEKGEFYSMKPSKTTTWLFEEGTFVPNGKLVGEESFSIQSNYLGTPEVMYNADGKVVWSAELDAYGDVRELTGERTDCPFRFQGQYEDRETGLYYNRFRYYSVEEGMYISQDPIGLLGGSTLYGYVRNTSYWIDPLGLIEAPSDLPDRDGIYIITNDKESYVGSSGIGEQGMNSRTSAVGHKNAQNLLNKEGTTVEYRAVYNLDKVKASDNRTANGNRNVILRYYEQLELDQQIREGLQMTNGKKKNNKTEVARILSEKNMKHAEMLVKKYNITIDDHRTTCKQS